MPVASARNRRMAKFGLTPGVWLKVVELAVGGVTLVAGAKTDQVWVQGVGALILFLAMGHFASGVTLAGRPWWRRRWPDAAAKSPIRVAGKPFVDFVPITDELHVAKTSLVSVNLHLQVLNAHRSGRTLQRVQAHLENDWGDRVRLMFRDATEYSDEIDLRIGKIAFLEVGFVAVDYDEKGNFGASRFGSWRRPLSHHGLGVEMSIDPSERSLHVGEKDGIRYASGTKFRVIITADDTPVFRIGLRFSRDNGSAYSWLQATRLEK